MLFRSPWAPLGTILQAPGPGTTQLGTLTCRPATHPQGLLKWGPPSPPSPLPVAMAPHGRSDLTDGAQPAGPSPPSSRRIQGIPESVRLHRKPRPLPTLSPTPDPAPQACCPRPPASTGTKVRAQEGAGCVTCFRGYLPDLAKPSIVGWNMCPELRAEVLTLTAQKGSG